MPRLACDVIVGTTPNLFSAVAAARVAVRRRKPLIQLVQDVVSSAAVETEQAGTLQAGSLLNALGFALRRAHAVTVPTDAFRPALRTLGVDDSQVHTVPNWSRIGETENVDGHPVASSLDGAMPT